MDGTAGSIDRPKAQVKPNTRERPDDGGIAQLIPTYRLLPPRRAAGSPAGESHGRKHERAERPAPRQGSRTAQTRVRRAAGSPTGESHGAIKKGRVH